MKKIQFTINKDTLIIDYKIENKSFKNINNTNIISKDDLIFDIRYFKNNLKIVAGFLNVMIKNENISKAVVEQEELIPTSLELLNYISTVKELVIKPDVVIDYDLHLAILKNDTLSSINCYSIPPYLLERIDTTKNIKIKTRNEVFFVSSFLRTNKLESYSEVYYKKKVVIDYEFTEIDFKDFEQFLSINNYLKTIYFEYVNIDLIKNIIKCLRDNKKDNINISIKGNQDNLAYFSDLEDYIKKSKYIKKNKIKFRIDYTQEYKVENFMKLINFTTLKYILITIIISCVIGYSVNQYDIYKSSQEINAITDEIADLLEEYENLDIENPDEDSTGDAQVPDPEESTTTEPEQSTTTPVTPTPSKPVYINPYYKNYAKVISVLKETNPDTVGWLTVNNTTVNYPVVQAVNNSYYLNHDFNKHSNSLGWIFMDYRNNPLDLDQNTVIYGHNLAKDKIMFGNLSATLNPNWYSNAKNQYITFNTASGDMQWRIFSIYKIAATNDYLYNKFDTQEQFLEFANKMKSRSIHDFGVEIKENDKMITLSTCQNSGKNRLVVHAVLVK